MTGRTVAVFDAELPPGVAFIRSLGRAGIDVVAFSSDRAAAGRFSRYTRSFRRCPPLGETDEFVGWLVDEMAAGRIDLVAPTSDYIAFNGAEAAILAGRDTDSSAESRRRLHDCLFKPAFARALALVGFPTPPTATPRSLSDALAFADEFAYPVLLKPRSHIGVGVQRGVVVRGEDSLRRLFCEYDVGDGHDRALAVDADLALQMIQAYRDAPTVEVVSVSGFLGCDGVLQALSHSRKTHAWPPRLGVGTQFQSLPTQSFTDHAVDAVRQVLGTGIFELEVLVDRRSGEYWAIDLNPRGFGQMALDMSLGHDLPMLWYRSQVGDGSVPAWSTAGSSSGSSRHVPRYWRMGVPHYAGAAVRLIRERHRGRAAMEMFRHLAAPTVGPVLDWRDPVPAVVWAARGVRHPGGLVRPFLNDTEIG